MKAREILTHAQVSILLACDRDTGQLTWLVNRGRLAKAGDVAGRLDKTYGYVIIKVHCQAYKAHRVVWLLMTGAWPDKFLDHIDGNRANNRFENLREATKAQNQQNRYKANSNNVSGCLGVTWNKRDDVWQSRIMIDKKSINLGSFKTLDEAKTAYLLSKRKMHDFGCI